MTMGALLNEKQSIDVNKLSNTHVYQSNYKLEWTQGASSDMGLAKKWIASICLEVDPDIIHFNNILFDIIEISINICITRIKGYSPYTCS